MYYYKEYLQVIKSLQDKSHKNLSSINSQVDKDHIIGGLLESITDREAKSLTEDQATYIYKKTELQGIVSADTNVQDVKQELIGIANIDTIRQEVEQERLSIYNRDDEVDP